MSFGARPGTGVRATESLPNGVRGGRAIKNPPKGEPRWRATGNLPNGGPPGSATGDPLKGEPRWRAIADFREGRMAKPVEKPAEEMTVEKARERLKIDRRQTFCHLLRVTANCY